MRNPNPRLKPIWQIVLLFPVYMAYFIFLSPARHAADWIDDHVP